MKKIILTLSALVVSFFLVACSPKPETDSSGTDITVTLEIQFDQETVERKEYTISSDNKVMDLLQVDHTIEEDAGLVTVIDGTSQDTSSNTYWMYDINGSLAPKGASEMELNDGDEVVFYLQQF